VNTSFRSKNPKYSKDVVCFKKHIFSKMCRIFSFVLFSSFWKQFLQIQLGVSVSGSVLGNPEPGWVSRSQKPGTRAGSPFRECGNAKSTMGSPFPRTRNPDGFFFMGTRFSNDLRLRILAGSPFLGTWELGPMWVPVPENPVGFPVLGNSGTYSDLFKNQR
jgi:hypothetical protein